MKIGEFLLERYLEAEYSAKYLLTCSDCDAPTIGELLAMEPGADKEFMNVSLLYTTSLGDDAMRDEIAKYYDTLTRDDILCFAGAEEGIFIFMNAMLDKGDGIISMAPSYQSHWEIAKAIGCDVQKWWLHDNGSEWTMDFDELKSLIKPNTKAVTVTCPNNPTGFTLTNDEIRELCDICREHDLYLFFDEVYRGLEMDGEPRISPADIYDKAISLNVMSKSFGMAGLRVGWFGTKNAEVRKLCAEYKSYISICDSAPSEYLTMIGLKHGKELQQINMERIQKNIKIADEFFARHQDIFSPRTMKCGPIAFHKLNIKMSALEFCLLALNKYQLLLSPSEMFEVDDGKYFRMGYGRAGFEEAIQRFDEMLANEDIEVE